MNALEAIAVALGLINVTLLVRRSIWNYPFGILMVLLYGHIFYDARLYSEALLQLFFLIVQIYGWWNWSRSKAEAGEIRVETLSARARALLVLPTIALILAWGALMNRHTDASFPWWDGAVAILSVVAQILLARRYIENWALWILVDLLAIGLYAAKGLWLTAGLYTVFLGLAAWGLATWLRVRREGRSAVAAAA